MQSFMYFISGCVGPLLHRFFLHGGEGASHRGLSRGGAQAPGGAGFRERRHMAQQVQLFAGLLGHRLRSCGTRAQLLHGLWDLPGLGTEPMSPCIGRQILNL